MIISLCNVKSYQKDENGNKRQDQGKQQIGSDQNTFLLCHHLSYLQVEGRRGYHGRTIPVAQMPIHITINKME